MVIFNRVIAGCFRFSVVEYFIFCLCRGVGRAGLVFLGV